MARPQDAADLARIYIESWQDTYAGVISHALLAAMSHKGHTTRWLAAIKSAERNSGGAVLVAEDARHGVIGLCSLGMARDGGAGFEGEVYTLYVDPAFFGRGTGRAFAGDRDKQCGQACVQFILHDLVESKTVAAKAKHHGVIAPLLL